MYSNSSLGATGRSLNIDDIEAHSTYSGATLTEYTPLYRNYPSIFEQELNGAPNGAYGTMYDLSTQDVYVTGTSTGNASFKGRETYYTYTLSTTYMTSNYLELFSYQPGTTINLKNAYWLASRCVEYSSNWFDYREFRVDRKHY